MLFDLLGILIVDTPTIQTYQKKWASEEAMIVYEIKTKAKEYDIDPDLAIRIAKAESSLKPLAVNHNTNGTKDLGLFQINDIHKVPDSCRLDYKCNVDWAIKTMSIQGTTPWNSSKHKWE